MPKFLFNKLVRDKLRDEYTRINQTAQYRKLSKTEYIEALKQKIIEEANEIPVDSTVDEIVSEIGDVQQAIDDLKKLHGISDEQVAQVMRKKFERKGGFSEGTFVETLEIGDGDEWLEYYEARPDVFPLASVPHKNTFDVPRIELGVYEHYKGNRYEVLGMGCHTETQEWFVVYKPLYDHDQQPDIWVRPYAMFTGMVELNGMTIPRFKKVGDDE